MIGFQLQGTIVELIGPNMMMMMMNRIELHTKTEMCSWHNSRLLASNRQWQLQQTPPKLIQLEPPIPPPDLMGLRYSVDGSGLTAGKDTLHFK